MGKERGCLDMFRKKSNRCSKPGMMVLTIKVAGRYIDNNWDACFGLFAGSIIDAIHFVNGPSFYLRGANVDEDESVLYELDNYVINRDDVSIFISKRAMGILLCLEKDG